MKYLRIRPLQLFVVECFIIVVIVIFLMYRYFELIRDTIDPTRPLPLSSIPMGQFSNAAVVSVGEPCAEIGTDVLRNGGNSVDAAIATMLCDCVVCPDITGVGGGFLMTIYNRTTNSSLFINAREMAPAAANVTMFVNRSAKSLPEALEVAVPGMIQGIWTTYKLYGGGVSWASLVSPTIQLCENGIVVSKRLSDNLKVAKDHVFKTGLKEYFVHNQTRELMKQGDIYTMSKLGHTLRTIADEGANAIYAGRLTSQFVADIQNFGGIITAEDLADYVVQVEESFEVKLKNGYKLYSGLPPNSGILLAYILRILDGMLPAPNAGLNAVRLMEAFKFAYGERSQLGDHMFVDASRILEKVTSDIYIDIMQKKISDVYTSPDPKFYRSEFSWTTDQANGTNNIAVLDSNGNAVTVTSSINKLFGSGIVSPSTGIILNNEMNDFSNPDVINSYGFTPSSANFIRPYKRPMSSECPTILTDHNGDVVLAIGGAGGSQITLATAYVSALVIWCNKTLKEAIEEPRLYHQLIPMQIDYEYGVLKSVIEELKHAGHQVRRLTNKDQSAVTAIYRTPEGIITAMTDFRQQGNVSGY